MHILIVEGEALAYVPRSAPLLLILIRVKVKCVAALSISWPALSDCRVLSLTCHKSFMPLTLILCFFNISVLLNTFFLRYQYKSSVLATFIVLFFFDISGLLFAFHVCHYRNLPRRRLFMFLFLCDKFSTFILIL